MNFELRGSVDLWLHAFGRNLSFPSIWQSHESTLHRDFLSNSHHSDFLSNSHHSSRALRHAQALILLSEQIRSPDCGFDLNTFAYECLLKSTTHKNSVYLLAFSSYPLLKGTASRASQPAQVLYIIPVHHPACCCVLHRVGLVWRR